MSLVNDRDNDGYDGDDLKQDAIQTAITGLITLIGEGHVFNRMMDEMQRVSKKYPDHDGDSLKRIVLEDAKIIFDDLVVPMTKFEINLLIEVGLLYMRGSLADVISVSS